MNIKQFLYQKYISHKYRVIFGEKCKINRKNIYQGGNAILNETRFANSILGFGSYVANKSNINYTKIGRFCALGDNVRTYLGIHPSRDFVSIHPAFFSTKKLVGFTFSDVNAFEEHKFLENSKYVVDIGNDVWIGNNVTIMDGVTIGNGAIIAAGTLVRNNVPDYAIVGGVPERIIRYRFDETQINFLLNFKWWDKDVDWLKRNYHNFRNISDFVKYYEV